MAVVVVAVVKKEKNNKENYSMAQIRFIKNIGLKVLFRDKETMIPFGFGEIYDAIKIEADGEGYNDIFMPDGSILKGVADEVFEKKRVPVIQVGKVKPISENFEIQVEEIEPESITLDGIILGEGEDYYNNDND